MKGFGSDLRLAGRRLLATPLFTIFAVLSLAVGVGVTTVVYSVVDALFLRELGFRDPERVLFVVTPGEGRVLRGSISEPDFQDLRAAQTTFASVSASAWFSPAVASATTTELMRGEAVDGAYFSTLGLSAALGRPIQPADDEQGARVVVLSHSLWRARFAADSSIVGRTIRVSGHPFEVIGVAPAGFDGASGGIPGTKLWIPLSAEASLAIGRTPGPPSPSTPRERQRLVVFGRLGSGATAASASEELGAIAARLDQAFPVRTGPARVGPANRAWRGKSIVAITEDDNIVRRFGLTIVALVALVLVVACTNLANLVLARGTARQHELAVRRALGAPRWRLVREQLAESLLIAGLGAIASQLVFQGLQTMMRTEFSLMLPMGGGRWMLEIDPALDATALAVSATSLLLSLAVFGLEPALQITRSADVNAGLAAGGGSVGAPRAARQRALLRWQVAISAGFFIIATMFIKYTLAEARHDSGVELDRLGVSVINFRGQSWDEPRVRQTLDRVLDQVRKDPAIESVALSTGMPFGLPWGGATLSVPGRPPLDPRDSGAIAVAATPSFFRTLGIAILRGRGFDDRDQPGSAAVAIVSEFTARRFFGTTDAAGRQLEIRWSASRTSAPLTTVIGVARDTDVGRVYGNPGPVVYVPFSQRYDPMLTIAARSTGDPALAARAIRDALNRTDLDLAVEVSGSGRVVLAGPFVFLRAAGLAALALGALTLLLAMVGLFGIQSHLVAYRTREIGVRMSLGASAAQIKTMVLKQGYRPVVEGLAIGLFIGLAGRAIVRAYLDVDVNVVDPWMLGVVPVPLLLAAFCACYLPADRASRVDPNVALRHL